MIRSEESSAWPFPLTATAPRALRCTPLTNTAGQFSTESTETQRAQRAAVTKRERLARLRLSRPVPDASFDKTFPGAASHMAQGIDDLLRLAVEKKASDLHLKVGNNPYIRIDGILVPLGDNARVTPEEMLSMAFSMMTNRQKQKFKETAELDMAYGVAGLGRFRVNVFQQRGNVGMVL